MPSWPCSLSAGRPPWLRKKRSHTARATPPTLAGLKIKQLRVPFPFTEGISEARVWLSKQLPAIKSGKMQSPDIVAVDFTPVADDWATITLDEPYTLTEEGVYVGYSFKTEKPNENTAQPVVTTRGGTVLANYSRFVYDANRDVITNPNNIDTGTPLRVPKLTKAQLDTTSAAFLQLKQEAEAACR